MPGPEPFRCLGCGAASASATHCAHCGGRTFELSGAAAITLAPPPPGDNLVPLDPQRKVRGERPRRTRRRRPG